MKTVFLIKRDLEYMWHVRHRVNALQWGAKYSPHTVEFRTFEEAAKALDNLPEYCFIGSPYFEIVKFLKK